MKNTKISFIFIMSSSFIMFLLFAILMLTGVLKNFDLLVLDFFSANRNVFFNWLFIIVTLLGETKVVVIVCAILLCLPNRKKLGLPLTIAVIISALLNLIIKLVFQRTRPVGYFLYPAPLGYNLPTSYSFPSGHAQSSTVFYFVLSYLLCKLYLKKQWQKILCWSGSIILCILICVSRVYIGVHFLSDVLCGLWLAIAVISLFIYIITFWREKVILHKNKLT